MTAAGTKNRGSACGCCGCPPLFADGTTDDHFIGGHDKTHPSLAATPIVWDAVAEEWVHIWEHVNDFPVDGQDSITATYADPLDVHPRCYLRVRTPRVFSVQFETAIPIEGEKWRVCWDSVSASAQLVTDPPEHKRYALEVEWIAEADCPVMRFLDLSDGTEEPMGEDVAIGPLPTHDLEPNPHKHMVVRLCYSEHIGIITASLELQGGVLIDEEVTPLYEPAYSPDLNRWIVLSHHRRVTPPIDPINDDDNHCAPRIWLETDKDSPGFYWFSGFSLSESLMYGATAETEDVTLPSGYQDFTGADGAVGPTLGPFTLSPAVWSRESNTLKKSSVSTAWAVHGLNLLNPFEISVQVKCVATAVVSIAFGDATSAADTTFNFAPYDPLEPGNTGYIEIVDAAGAAITGRVYFDHDFDVFSVWHVMRFCYYPVTGILHVTVELDDGRTIGTYAEVAPLVTSDVTLIAGGSASAIYFDDWRITRREPLEGTTAGCGELDYEDCPKNTCPCCGPRDCQKLLRDTDSCHFELVEDAYVWRGSWSGVNDRCEYDETIMLSLDYSGQD